MSQNSKHIRTDNTYLQWYVQIHRKQKQWWKAKHKRSEQKCPAFGGYLLQKPQRLQTVHRRVQVLSGWPESLQALELQSLQSDLVFLLQIVWSESEWPQELCQSHCRSTQWTDRRDDKSRYMQKVGRLLWKVCCVSSKRVKFPLQKRDSPQVCLKCLNIP